MNFDYVNKYPEVDPFRYRRSLILLGLVISLFLAFILFNMTTTAEKTKYLSGGEIFTGMVFSPPPTMDEKPKPKLPPPVAVELVPVADIKGSRKISTFCVPISMLMIRFPIILWIQYGKKAMTFLLLMLIQECQNQ